MVVPKGVPVLLSPELLYALARMGHGDEIGERPGPEPHHARAPWEMGHGRGLRDVRPETPAAASPMRTSPPPRSASAAPRRSAPTLPKASGASGRTLSTGLTKVSRLGIPQLLEAVLKLLPLDTYVESPAAVMELGASDKARGLQTPVWEDHEALLARVGCTRALEKVERFAFYERAKKAFTVVATGETALYGNLILKKGVLAPDTPH